MLYWIDGKLVIPQENQETFDYWVDGKPLLSNNAAKNKVITPLMSFKPKTE